MRRQEQGKPLLAPVQRQIPPTKAEVRPRPTLPERSLLTKLRIQLRHAGRGRCQTEEAFDSQSYRGYRSDYFV